MCPGISSFRRYAGTHLDYRSIFPAPLFPSDCTAVLCPSSLSRGCTYRVLRQHTGVLKSTEYRNVYDLGKISKYLEHRWASNRVLCRSNCTAALCSDLSSLDCKFRVLHDGKKTCNQHHITHAA